MKSLSKVVKSVAKYFHQKKTVKTFNDTSSEHGQDTSKESELRDVENMAVESQVETKPWMTEKEIQAVNLSLAKGHPPVLPVASDLMDRRIAVSMEFIARMNAHNSLGGQELGTNDFLVHFCDQSKQLHTELAWNCWYEILEVIFEAFPDFNFKYQKVVPVAGAVVVLGFQAGGTHTGTPYAYGPCEPIPSSGKAVLNDPEEFYFFFREGEDKIARIMICPLGELTGPPGLYVQIGGFPMIP